MTHINIKQIEETDDLDEFILDSIENNMVVLLYFGASWCGPCKKLKERLKEKDTYKLMPLLSVASIDIDSNEYLSNLYKVESLPTQIFINVDNNKVNEVSRIEGYDFTRLKLEYDKYNK